MLLSYDPSEILCGTEEVTKLFDLNMYDYEMSKAVQRLCREREGVQDALILLFKLRKKYPDSAFVDTLLSDCYAELGNKKQKRYYAQSAEGKRLKGFNPALRASYLKLAAMLKERNIKGVFMQYPLRSIIPLKRLFDDNASVFFVDNRRNFEKALKCCEADTLFKDRFAGDFGRCTYKGSFLIAKTGADAVLAATGRR